ncbi:YggS family pyridoxal phosphate-dependent enzyme [Hyphomonas sp. FCG-A18]|uniref:YggS family pyridoxal phosphate-dependent enzyme n=1 Tax=Hyphomonas sp. FCG-A18 TaxID=3080019 RepID=UPI002B29344F|nr:YggS family pyridoxal phosphate-dependent enzyme [Hyphomonas sp. FCG-A18]
MTSPTPPETIAEARTRILSEIGESVTLVAASKRQPEARIEEALAARQRVFGENRVQEAQARWSERKEQVEGLELRLIGPLQTNKAEEAVALFDVIETLDREKLLKALVKAVEKTGAAPPDLFIQVNTGNEPQKGGVSVEDLPDLSREAREQWPGAVRGLMCIPPAEEPAGPHFALLKKLADRHGLSQVSMGMSGDYALAARLGATHVRVGTALFGAREA